MSLEHRPPLARNDISLFMEPFETISRRGGRWWWVTALDRPEFLYEGCRVSVVHFRVETGGWES